MSYVILVSELRSHFFNRESRHHSLLVQIAAVIGNPLHLLDCFHHSLHILAKLKGPSAQPQYDVACMDCFKRPVHACAAVTCCDGLVSEPSPGQLFLTS